MDHSCLFILIVLLKRVKFLSNKNLNNNFVYDVWVGKCS